MGQEIMLEHLASASQGVDALRDQLRATDGTGFYDGFRTDEAIKIFPHYHGAESGFTRVIKDPGNHRVSVLDYRKAYPDHYSAIARDFRLAAAVSEDPLVCEQLVRTAEVLQTPDIPWEEVYRASLPTVESPVRPYLGEEVYDDPLKIKSTPLFWVDRLIPDRTEALQRYVERARGVYKAEYTDNIPEITLRVSEPLITSVMFREMRWSANTQPNSIDWLLRNGAVTTIMDSARRHNFVNNMLPYARGYIDPEIVSRYFDEELEEAHDLLLALHEAAHPLTFSEFGDMKELKDVRMVYHEIYPTTLALSLAQRFEDERRLEQFLIIAATWAISDFILATVRPEEDDYAQGEAGGMLGFGLANGGFEIVDNNSIGWSSVSRALRVINEFNGLIREPMSRSKVPFGDSYRRAKDILREYNGFPTLYTMVRRRQLTPEISSQRMNGDDPSQQMEASA